MLHIHDIDNTITIDPDTHEFFELTRTTAFAAGATHIGRCTGIRADVWFTRRARIDALAEHPQKHAFGTELLHPMVTLFGHVEIVMGGTGGIIVDREPAVIRTERQLPRAGTRDTGLTSAYGRATLKHRCARIDTPSEGLDEIPGGVEDADTSYCHHPRRRDGRFRDPPRHLQALRTAPPHRLSGRNSSSPKRSGRRWRQQQSYRADEQAQAAHRLQSRTDGTRRRVSKSYRWSLSSCSASCYLSYSESDVRWSEIRVRSRWSRPRPGRGDRPGRDLLRITGASQGALRRRHRPRSGGKNGSIQRAKAQSSPGFRRSGPTTASLDDNASDASSAPNRSVDAEIAWVGLRIFCGATGATGGEGGRARFQFHTGRRCGDAFCEDQFFFLRTSRSTFPRESRGQ